LSACSTLRVNDEREIRATPTTAPATIYVTDFQLAPGSFQAESGMLPISSASLGMPGDSLTRLFGVPQDNAARTRELVALMSSTLLEDLANAELNARHLTSGELLPKQGWMVRGAFAQVDEGNRLRRTLIGFGSGATRLRVIDWIDRPSMFRASGRL